MAKSKPRYFRHAVKEITDGRLVALFELAYDRDLFIEALAKVAGVKVRKCYIRRRRPQ